MPRGCHLTKQAALSSQSVITRGIAVAEGVFAPDHLGELTQIVPFEMVGTVSAERGVTQREPRRHGLVGE